MRNNKLKSATKTAKGHEIMELVAIALKISFSNAGEIMELTVVIVITFRNHEIIEAINVRECRKHHWLIIIIHWMRTSSFRVAPNKG